MGQALFLFTVEAAPTSNRGTTAGVCLAAFRVGAPYLSDASVEARIVEDEAKGPKLTVFKYKRKDHYKRKTGHRQPLTTFVVTKIA